MVDALTLLSGDAQTFAEKVWATRAHLHRADPADLVGLLSLGDVDHLLTETQIRTPAVRLAQDGQVLPASRFTRRATMAGQDITGLVDARKVLALFEGGATLVLQGLQRYWSPLGRLVADLEAQLGHPCQANAYLTPPGNQGFAVHEDRHDVFVFQTHGAKQWEVHEDGEVRAVLMEPGLSMYLPTGTPHAARAQDSVSLHVTLGINQLTWRGFLERTVRSVLDGLPQGHLPAGYHLDEDFEAEVGRRLGGLTLALGAVDTAEAAEREATRFATHRPPRMPGGLRDVLARDRLHDASRLRRRPGSMLRLVDDPSAGPEGRLRVQLGDRELRVPLRLRPVLDTVAVLPELTPADLADHLDADGRLVLCRRLVHEGLLEIVG